MIMVLAFLPVPLKSLQSWIEVVAEPAIWCWQRWTNAKYLINDAQSEPPDRQVGSPDT